MLNICKLVHVDGMMIDAKSFLVNDNSRIFSHFISKSLLSDTYRQCQTCESDAEYKTFIFLSETRRIVSKVSLKLASATSGANLSDYRYVHSVQG